MDLEIIKWLGGGVLTIAIAVIGSVASVYRSEQLRIKAESDKQTAETIAVTNDRFRIKQLEDEVQNLCNTAVSSKDLVRLEAKVDKNASDVDKHLRRIYGAVKGIPVAKNQLDNTVSDVAELDKRVSTAIYNLENRVRKIEIHAGGKQHGQAMASGDSGVIG